MAGILADITGFGRIYECWDCPNIQVQVGFVSITLTRESYMQLVDMVNTSAANFELLRHRDETAEQASSGPIEESCRSPEEQS